MPTQLSITANVLRFKETKSVRVLIELIIQIVRERRAVELIYGGYCALWHRPSAVHPCDDEEALTRILDTKGEFIRNAPLSRGQLMALFGESLAIHALPDDFAAARRESVWLNDTCLILGEYGESARIACLTARSCVISEHYRPVAGVRHIHSIQRYGKAGEFLVSTGDGRKFLDVWVASRGEIRFVRRLRRRLAGFTAAVEVNGQYYFGSDFSGRPNFIETLGGVKYFFPEKAYRLHVTGFYALFDRYIVSANTELQISGGRKTLSVFDTLKRRFVFCDFLDLDAPPATADRVPARLERPIPRLAIHLALGLALAAAPLVAQQPLSRAEQRVRRAVAAGVADQIGYLQRVVDMPSSTLDLEGVRAVGAVFARSLDSLGFETRWADMPAGMRRAGHLIAEHRGKKGKARLLLIGHLDTVVAPDGATFTRRDSIATGIGATDMKGGDVVVLYALKALAAAGALRDLNLTIVFTGDEEHAGSPLELSRRDLIEAARRSDVALGFESGHQSDLTVARRGAASWRLTTTGAEAHSAGIFREGIGYGAIYELARILDEFRRELAGRRYLSFNVATVLGGTDLAYDSVAIRGTTASKLNIVPRVAVAHGDLRFISAEQHDSAKRHMAGIVARHLPGTGARIVFEEEYPAMSPTAGNDRVLAVYDTVSRALGYGDVVALDPGRRGAGDISFVAPYVDGVDGLGTLGGGSHTPDEHVEISALEMQTARAAIFMHRLGTRPAAQFVRRTR